MILNKQLIDGVDFNKSQEFINQIHALPCKDIAIQIRKDLKEFLPQYKFSVVSDSRSIWIYFISWLKFFTDEYMRADKAGCYEEVQRLYREHWNSVCMVWGESYRKRTMYTEEGERALLIAEKIHRLYNHDNNDLMTDYFDVNYYWRVEVWKWDKPYVIN